MRLLAVLLLLPAMAIADDQVPLKQKAAAWFEKAKSYIPSAAPPSPIDAGASKVAGLVVEKITKNNWRTKLLPVADDGSKVPQEWMVMFSGNTSCYGRCDQADRAFNVRSRLMEPSSWLGSILIGFDVLAKYCYPSERCFPSEARTRRLRQGEPFVHNLVKRHP
jgi:hypothetical protein